MSMGLAFWILMLLWLVGHYPFITKSDWQGLGMSLLPWLLFLLLGWQVFGAPLHG